MHVLILEEEAIYGGLDCIKKKKGNIPQNDIHGLTQISSPSPSLTSSSLRIENPTCQSFSE